MILILDDDRSRVKAYRQRLVGASVIHVETAEEAIQLLRRTTPAVICLDYDLHQFGMPIERSGTGWEVALYLGRHRGSYPKTRIVVHSLNPFGGTAMWEHLESAGFPVTYEPGAWKDSGLCDQLVVVDRAA